MRVLQVCQPSDGGVAHQVHLLSAELRERGYSVEVACSAGALADTLRGEGFRVETFPLVREASPRRDLAATLGLWRMIRSGDYSLVHTHSAKGGAVGRVAAYLARTPRLYTPHAWSFLMARHPVERALYVAAEQVLGLLTDGIICVSSGELALGRRSLRGCGRRLRLVPNGLDLPPQAGRETAGGEVLSVGSLARLTRQKGIEYLLSAAEGVCARRADVRFSVAGDGPDLGRLRQEAADRGLADRFEFVGPVPEPWEYLSTLDVFVLPSLWEGMPFALLEAMGTGLPAVATDVGGVRDAIPDGAVGTVVPAADSGALAEAILDYAESPRLREATGAAARRRVLREFSRERMVERTVEAYSAAVRRRPSAATEVPQEPVGGVRVGRDV